MSLNFFLNLSHPCRKERDVVSETCFVGRDTRTGVPFEGGSVTGRTRDHRGSPRSPSSYGPQPILVRWMTMTLGKQATPLVYVVGEDIKRQVCGPPLYFWCFPLCKNFLSVRGRDVGDLEGPRSYFIYPVLFEVGTEVHVVVSGRKSV